MTRRELFLRYAEKQIGKPYIWGGDDPLLGWDCSGLVIECGQAVGMFPSSYDNTAKGLYAKYAAEGRKVDAITRPGCLAFWSMNDQSKIHHVEIVWALLDDVPLWVSIGASGGGSTTASINVAAKQNAFVKVRPVTERGMNLFFVDPF